MKQTPLERKSELKRGPGPKRKGGLKQSQPKRDWTEARAKVDAEEVCRLGAIECPTTTGCDCPDTHGECMYACFGRLEAAHIIGRERDATNGLGVRGEYHHPPTLSIWPVAPDRIVPLCTRHHKQYDAHEIDLLGHLTPEEEAQAVLDADGLELARRRLCPTAYRKGAVL